MTMREFSDKAFACAKALGCEAAETYFAEQEEFSVNAAEGAIESYDVSKKGGLSLRVTVNGRDGYAYTESLDDPEELVRRAADNAGVISSLDPHPMQGKCEYRAIAQQETPMQRMPESARIQLAIDLEAATKGADERVKRVVYSNVGCGGAHVVIRNTKGLDAERSATEAFAYVMPLMQQGDEVKTSMAFRYGKDATDVAACAKEAVEEAAVKFGAKPIASGEYRVILRNTAMADLLQAFSGIFSAEEAQSGRSLLAGKEGDIVAAPCITLVDDPLHEMANLPFDDEGTPTYRKNIIECGALKTLLHNLKTAKKAGVATTGNALRASAASPVDVGPSACYFEAGEASFAALLDALGTGLVVTDLDGLHAGVDPISGDFSLKTTGYLVENGRKAQPVTEITVAGNFLKLLSAVEAVGSDLRFGLPGGASFGSPSLLVSRLTVAGK